MDTNKKIKYIKRIGLVYCFSTLLYFPFILKGGIASFIKKLLFGNHHLWYLSALLIGLILLWIVERFFKFNYYSLGLVLLAVGIFFDEYYKIFDFVVWNGIASFIEYVGGARHAMFFGLPMLLIGGWLAEKKINISKTLCIVLFSILFVFGFLEACFLKSLIGTNITLDVSIWGWTPAVPLFLIGLETRVKLKPEKSRIIRKTIDIVYIIHVWVLCLVEKMSKVEYFTKFVVVVVISFLLSILLISLSKIEIIKKVVDKL